MSKPFENKIAVHFEQPLTAMTDGASVRAAYGVLAKQIIDYAKILEKDHNILAVDSVLITNPEDYMKRADTPVSTRLSELVSAGTAVKDVNKVKKATAVSTPELPDAEEPPRVQTMSMDQIQAIRQEAKNDKTVTVTANPVQAPVQVKDSSDEILDKIFENLKRTEKSVKILTVFAKEAGNEVTVEQLVKATKLENSDINSWLGQTGIKIKAIKKTGRGVYKLDPDKL